MYSIRPFYVIQNFITVLETSNKQKTNEATLATTAVYQKGVNMSLTDFMTHPNPP